MTMPSNWFIMALAILVVTGAGVLTLNHTSHAKSSFEERYPDLPKDALQRRAKSMARLKAEGVPLNEWLPVIESETDVAPRSTREVALRAVTLLAVALKGEGLENEQLEPLVEKFQITQAYSPKEKAFMHTSQPSKAEVDAFSWRYEAAYILFWSLGYAESPSSPTSPHDPAALVGLLKTHTLDQIVAGAKMKPIGQILDQADLIYRYRWALVDARAKGSPTPAGLNDDVAMERHHALNWLTRYMDEEWDDISLDT